MQLRLLKVTGQLPVVGVVGRNNYNNKESGKGTGKEEASILNFNAYVPSKSISIQSISDDAAAGGVSPHGYSLPSKYIVFAVMYLSRRCPLHQR